MAGQAVTPVMLEALDQLLRVEAKPGADGIVAAQTAGGWRRRSFDPGRCRPREVAEVRARKRRRLRTLNSQPGIRPEGAP